MGEALVLVAAAMGVVSLVRSGAPILPQPAHERRKHRRDEAVNKGSQEHRALTLGRPSVILDTTLNAVFHTVIVFALYLHFAGHNSPGGGFIAGLVIGVGLLLRVITGRAMLRGRIAVSPNAILGIGILLVTGTPLTSLVLGNALLEHHTWQFTIPVLGEAKTTSALPFDTGILLIVVGTIASLIEVLVDEVETTERAEASA